MNPEILASFRRDLDAITDPKLPAWLVDGAKFCAASLEKDRILIEKQAQETLAIMDVLEPFVYGCPCHKDNTPKHKEAIDEIIKIIYHKQGEN
jgi:hypothetical protein